MLQIYISTVATVLRLMQYKYNFKSSIRIYNEAHF